MTNRKFFKTVFTIEVLSEERISPNIGSYELYHGINRGDWSGEFNHTETKELNGKEAANALIGQGSDPEFFQIDENGEDICDDEMSQNP